jgi:hypothetical protein
MLPKVQVQVSSILSGYNFDLSMGVSRSSPTRPIDAPINAFVYATVKTMLELFSIR